LAAEKASREVLLAAVKAKDVNLAEATFAAIAQKGPREAFDELLYTVQDDTQVHRTVLPYRAWELLSLVGEEHAHTMLRQSVRFCVKEQSRGEVSKVLTKVLDEHRLLGRTPGDRTAEDAWVDGLSQTIARRRSKPLRPPPLPWQMAFRQRLLARPLHSLRTN
jgi:hypothetical protein